MFGGGIHLVRRRQKHWGLSHTVSAGLCAVTDSHWGENESLSLRSHITSSIWKHSHIKWSIIPLSSKWGNGYLCSKHRIALQFSGCTSEAFCSFVQGFGHFRWHCGTTDKTKSLYDFYFVNFHMVNSPTIFNDNIQMNSLFIVNTGYWIFVEYRCGYQ